MVKQRHWAREKLHILQILEMIEAEDSFENSL
jgi:hypothetical protein